MSTPEPSTANLGDENAEVLPGAPTSPDALLRGAAQKSTRGHQRADNELMAGQGSNQSITTTSSPGQGAGDGTSLPEGGTTAPTPGSEAAKWRTKLREAETQRDGLSARVQALQRSEALRLAGEHLAAGEDLFGFGATLDDLLDEQGDLDPEAVQAAAAAVAIGRPGLARVHGKVGDFQGIRSTPTAGATWADVIRNR